MQHSITITWGLWVVPFFITLIVAYIGPLMVRRGLELVDGELKRAMILARSYFALFFIALVWLFWAVLRLTA